MTTLPQPNRFIPLSKAAKRLGISVSSLRSLIQSGNIRAVSLDGTVAVAESELDQIIAITRDQFEHFHGQSITVAEAVAVFQVSNHTLRNWIDRNYIKVLRPGYGMALDKADVAYCAAVYHARGGMRGSCIFDKNGLPYQPKQTEWAEYQRERRKKKGPTR